MLRGLDQSTAQQAGADPAWYDVVGQFNQVAAQVGQHYLALEKLRSYVAAHPSLQADYSAVMQGAQTQLTRIAQIQTAIQSAQAALSNAASSTADVAQSITDAVSNAFSSAASFFGLSGAGLAGARLAGLGLVPEIIAASVIAAAIAAATYWITSAVNFENRVSAMQQLEAQGVSPAQASAIVAQQANAGGLFSGLSAAPIALAVLGLGAVFVLPKILGGRHAA